MKQYGVRNATLMAIVPFESSSVVINSTNGIQLLVFIRTRKSKAGSFTQHDRKIVSSRKININRRGIKQIVSDTMKTSAEIGVVCGSKASVQILFGSSGVHFA